MRRTAMIDGDYRYRLDRIWNEEKARIAFVMLNPSTADGQADDPTIRRCIRFACDWGFGQLTVVNLSPLRSPKPLLLRGARYSWEVFERNIDTIKDVIYESDIVVAAWGAHPIIARHPLFEASQLVWQAHGKLGLLGKTKSGYPQHPLYIPAERPLRVVTW